MNIILSNGTIKTIGKPPFDLPTVTLHKRRVSTITPMFAPKRQLFFLLRWLFGEEGRAAEFTRRWRGPWRVDVLACGARSVFMRRESAVQWEMSHMENCDKCLDYLLE